MARPCGKKRYRDQLSAKLALARIAHRDDYTRPKSEQRVYRCHICHSWHLTSKERAA